MHSKKSRNQIARFAALGYAHESVANMAADFGLKVRTREHGFTGSVVNYGAIIWMRTGMVLLLK